MDLRLRRTSLSIADHARGAPEVVLPSERGGLDRTLLSFSSDGRWLLVDNQSQYQQDGPGSNLPGGRALAIPTTGGEPVPVADDPVINPTWPQPGTLLRTNVIGVADRMRLNRAPDTILAYVDGDRVLLPVEDLTAPRGRAEIRGPHAHNYTENQDDPAGPLVEVTDFEPSLVWAAGAMISTPTDLNRFCHAPLNGRLLTRETTARMQSTVPWQEFLGADPGYGTQRS